MNPIDLESFRSRDLASLVLITGGCWPVMVNEKHRELSSAQFETPVDEAHAEKLIAREISRFGKQPTGRLCYCSDMAAPIALVPDDCPFEAAHSRLGRDQVHSSFAYLLYRQNGGRTYQVFRLISRKFSYRDYSFLESVLVPHPSGRVAIHIYDQHGASSSDLMTEIKLNGSRVGKPLSLTVTDEAYLKFGEKVEEITASLENDKTSPDQAKADLIQWLQDPQNPVGYNSVVPFFEHLLGGKSAKESIDLLRAEKRRFPDAAALRQSENELVYRVNFPDPDPNGIFPAKERDMGRISKGKGAKPPEPVADVLKKDSDVSSSDKEADVGTPRGVFYVRPTLKTFPLKINVKPANWPKLKPKAVIQRRSLEHDDE